MLLKEINICFICQSTKQLNTTVNSWEWHQYFFLLFFFFYNKLIALVKLNLPTDIIGNRT